MRAVIKPNSTEIEQFKPCQDALEFRMKFKTFEEAWDNCPRGDWMLWIANRVNVNVKILTKTKALCALTVRHLMKDQRSINACEVALKFADGLATLNDLSAAAAAAAAAAYAAAYAAAAADAAAYAAAAADADAAAAAAYAAAYAAAADAAADAAYAAAYADAAAADAAYAYAAAADAAAADAHKKNQKKTADLCREILTAEVLEKITKL